MNRFGLNFHLVMILVSVCLLSRDGACQDKSSAPLPNDSENKSSIFSPVEKTGKFLLEGVLHGRYKKPGWREFLVPQRLDLPELAPGKLSPHPRLLSSYQLNHLKFKLSRKPYRDWYLLIKRSAESLVSNPLSRVKNYSVRIKANAFLYRIEKNPQYLDRAIALLELLPEPPEIEDLEGGKANIGWGDYLQSAEPIPDICVAYDLLYDDLPAGLRSEVQRKVLGVVQQLIDGFLVTPRNNHVTVMSIAVATSALAFDDIREYVHYTRGELFRVGMDHLSQSLGLIAPDGGYAEGPYYARYILNYLSPFSVHLQNALHRQIFEHPYLERMVNWVIDNDKGSNRFTQFDDAFVTKFFILPPLISFSRYGGYWNDYFSQSEPFAGYSPNMIEGILNYEPPQLFAFSRPVFPARFYPDMGQVIFHSNQPKPHFFASFIYEQEGYFADVHEQIDPLSMEISADGSDFIIDGGYGSNTSDPDRPYFISPQANSTILVDGFGTDTNPLVGDELQGHLQFAFSTENFGAAALLHQIGDVTIHRQIFYSGRNRLFLLDNLEGSQTHSYTVQLQYLGEFRDFGGGDFRLQKENSALNVHLLSDTVSSWKLQESRGLGTGPAKVFEHSTLKITSEKIRQGSLASLWVAGSAESNTLVKRLPLAEGSGEWRQIHDIGSSETEDMVWNRGGEVSTIFWQGSAEFTWVRYNIPAEPDAILLVEGNYFRQGSYSVRFSRPVTFYLERKGSNWGGYIYFDSRLGPVQIEISGIDALPVRLNGQALPVEKVNGNFRIQLAEPGELVFGLGEFLIDVPQKHLPEENFLEWISRRPAIRRDPAYWSEYERTLFKNQVTDYTLYGSSEALRYWGENITGDSLIFFEAANVTQGLLQYGYHSESDGKGFRLPHQYNFDGQIGNSRWTVNEEGDWRGTGIDVRDFWLRGQIDRRWNLDYRFQHPFGDYWGHNFSADFKRHVGIRSRYTKTSQVELQDYGILVQQRQFEVSPSMLLKDRQVSTLRLDSRAEQVQGSFRADNLEDEAHYSEIVNGIFLNRLHWLLQGYQNPEQERQQYRGQFAGYFLNRHFFSTGVTANHNREWQISRGNFSWNGQFANWQPFQDLQYREEDWLWQGGISNFSGNGSFLAAVKLKNWQFGQSGLASLVVSRFLRSSTVWNSRLEYAYNHTDDAYQLLIGQQWWLTASEHVGISPLWREAVGEHAETRALGLGVTTDVPVPISVQLFQDRSYVPFQYQSEMSVVLPLPLLGSLWLDSTLLWSADSMLYNEIRVQKRDEYHLSPGLFYRYLRNREQRWEGFLEWRW